MGAPRIVLLPMRALTDWWPKLAPLVVRAGSRVPTYGVTLEDVQRELLTGRAWAFLALDGEELVGEFIARVEQEMTRRVLRVWTLSGERMSEWIDGGMDELLRMAAAFGCNALVGAGRPGWPRRLRTSGWHDVGGRPEREVPPRGGELWVVDQAELFDRIAGGNAAARQFLDQIFATFHVYDDLIDRDHDVAPMAIHQAFRTSLVSLPANPFYVQHFGLLHSLVANAITEWRIANDLERAQDESDLRIAFISRSSYVPIFVQVAALIHGPDAAVWLGGWIRRVFHREGFDQYRRNLDLEFAAREAKE